MSLRDDMKIDWEYNDTKFTPPNNPLLSKRLVIERLNKIKDILLTEKIPNDYSTIEAIKNMNVLIQEIQEDKLKPGNL
jgi:hypothetical protein